jgi:hypothetical protein
MSLAWIICLVCAVIAALFVVLVIRQRRSAGGDLDQIAARIRQIDVDNFRNLIDPAEQSFLHDHLPSLQFRAVHFERMRAASQYLLGTARNARLMIQLAEAAKQNAGPAALETAERLQRNAMQVCLHAYRVVPRLWLSAFVPSFDKRADTLAAGYANVFRETLALTSKWAAQRTGSSASGSAGVSPLAA